MSQEDSEEDSKNSPRQAFQERLTEYDPKWLIKEYKEANKEARYRDKLMHNSYYLIAIALVLFFGNIVNSTGGDVDTIISNLPDFVLLFGSTGGLLLIFLAVVMDTYNEKRNRAESRRRDIEEALTKQLSESNSENPPFAIQQHVILDDVVNYSTAQDTPSRTQNLITKLAHKGIREYSIFLFRLGILLISLSFFALLYLAGLALSGFLPSVQFLPAAVLAVTGYRHSSASSDARTDSY